MVSSIESQMYFLFHRDMYVLRVIAICELCHKDIFLHLQIESVKYQLPLG